MGDGLPRQQSDAWDTVLVSQVDAYLGGLEALLVQLQDELFHLLGLHGYPIRRLL